MGCELNSADVCKKLEIMKTIITLKTSSQFHNLLSGIGKSFILIMICFSTINAQNTEKSPYLLGASVGSHASGNSHGTIYDAGVGLYNGENVFSLGACMQKRSMKFCGASFQYNRILTGKEDFAAKESRYAIDPSKLQLFLYSRIEYVNNAELSYNAVKKEETLVKNQSEVPVNCNNIKLSTIDLSAGVGLNIRLSKQLVWSNYIGFGTYYHLNYTPGMYCEKASPVLVLGTALRLNYFNR